MSFWPFQTLEGKKAADREKMLNEIKSVTNEEFVNNNYKYTIRENAIEKAAALSKQKDEERNRDHRDDLNEKIRNYETHNYNNQNNNAPGASHVGNPYDILDEIYTNHRNKSPKKPIEGVPINYRQKDDNFDKKLPYAEPLPPPIIVLNAKPFDYRGPNTVFVLPTQVERLTLKNILKGRKGGERKRKTLKGRKGGERKRKTLKGRKGGERKRKTLKGRKGCKIKRKTLRMKHRKMSERSK